MSKQTGNETAEHVRRALEAAKEAKGCQVKPNDGGAAIPTSADRTTGITIRDYFATAAMQGMLSCQDFMNEATRLCGSRDEARGRVAEWAFKQADAMLAARAK